MLSETWVEEESWKTVREKLPAGVYLGVASGDEKTCKRKGKEGDGKGNKKKTSKGRYRDGGRGEGNNDGVREAGQGNVENSGSLRERGYQTKVKENVALDGG